MARKNTRESRIVCKRARDCGVFTRVEAKNNFFRLGTIIKLNRNKKKMLIDFTVGLSSNIIRIKNCEIINWIICEI